MTETCRLVDLGSERGILRLSIGATLLIALIGIGFGLVTGSFSIIFDGIESMIDASMSLLSLIVANLITSYATSGRLSRKLRERFSMGFWHLEPIVLGLNGTLLIGAAVYALVHAVGSLLEGGRTLAFDWAIVYAAIAVVLSVTVAVVATRANRHVGSAFVRLDVRGWMMSAGIGTALLVAFGIGAAIQGTRWQWLSPYIDPVALAFVCLCIIPLPVATIRQALSDILLVTPADLKQHVEERAQAFVLRHGLVSWRAYVARVGRSTEIELYFIVPPDAPARTIGEWDALRDEIGDALGEDSPDRWLTVGFTGDPEWAE